MSTSRAIKPKRDDTVLSNWQSVPERAPSVERDEAPTVARIIAMVGLFLFVLGVLAISAPLWRLGAAFISPAWGLVIASVGVSFILYHAFVERDFQFRRLYGFLGLALVVGGGIVLRAIAFRANFTDVFMLYGVPALAVGLVFLVAVVRNETDISFRNLILNTVGVVGALMVGFAAMRGLMDGNYLAGEGIVLLILGLFYGCTYIGQQNAANDERAYYAGLAIGGLGLLGIAVTVARCTVGSTAFFVPGGLILSGMSIVYLTISIGICVDWPIVILARRDLAAYFYSPVGYLVFIGLTFVSGLMFYQFAELVLILGPRGQLIEPIIIQYIFSLIPVVVQMFVVPVVTMRLLSEENRSGTLEVLMTAPISEVSVVLGKFLACWIFYMLTWLPTWLFLVSLRYFGKESFDYLPILSFTLALGVISAGLLAMGLFFSSMTSNQIIAAVLTFVGVMLHLVIYFFERSESFRAWPALVEVFGYVNFFDLWDRALGGTIAPRYLVFHLSVAVVFLFATVKMLESRKWK
jgi:ABC-2 type transport system permease protein